MSVIDKIYNHSPLIMQNMMISAYGYKLKRMRYGGEFSSNYRSVKRSYLYNDEQLRDLQNQNLVDLIKAVAKHTPHYINTANLGGTENVSVDTIAEYFPVLDKHVVRENQSDFYNVAIKKSELQYISTSGTSGTPLKVAVTKESIRKNYAFFARFLDIAGVSRSKRSATFAGRIFIPENQNKSPYWRYNIANNNLLLSTYRISDQTIPEYIEALEKWRPYFIDSYPSAIYVVAKYIIDNKIEHDIGPAAIITSSETLLEEHRRVIEAAFGCAVYDHYGCAEMSALITQCAKGSYHINSDYGLIEILDEEGKVAKPGEIGEIVCTGFVNQAMPLIRYKIGDSAILSDKKCECGCNFPVLESIVGRSDDMIIAPDGRRIGRLDPVFKGAVGIKECQIIQTDINNINVIIVPDSAYTESSGKALVYELKLRVGEEFNVDIILSDSIQKTSSGKFKSVVSMVSK